MMIIIIIIIISWSSIKPISKYWHLLLYYCNNKKNHIFTKKSVLEQIGPNHVVSRDHTHKKINKNIRIHQVTFFSFFLFDLLQLDRTIGSYFTRYCKCMMSINKNTHAHTHIHKLRKIISIDWIRLRQKKMHELWNLIIIIIDDKFNFDYIEIHFIYSIY